MIDISSKFETLREARAEARVKMAESTVETVRKGQVPKGNVLEIARVAAVMATKKTSELIPFCHPLPIDFVGIDYKLKKNEIAIRSEVRSIWKTGVEMEALTAVSVAALTIYDMLKPLDKGLVIEKIVLLEKKGGKSDFQDRFTKPLKGGVLVISDSTFKGERKDKSGEIIRNRLKEYPIVLEEFKILPDDKETISKEVIRLSDKQKLDIIITTGGTGLGPKDVTPEATQEVLDRIVPGITEAMRSFGQRRTPYAMLSRNVAGVRGKTLIINLPGSSRGVRESMSVLFPGILHSMRMIWGRGHNISKNKK
jgi:molybdenum cofactor biosynthesis protein MoaC